MNPAIAAATQLKFYRHGVDVFVTLTGPLRMHNSEEIKLRILKYMDAPCERLYIHLGRVTELDSAGLGVLVGLHMTARKKNIAFKLLSPAAFQMTLFTTTRLNQVITIVSGIEAEQLRERLEREEFAIE